MAERPSGARQITCAGPGMGMTRGSVPQARSVSAAHVAGSGALTARVKNMPWATAMEGAISQGAPGSE
jgi:hypothetical protein